MKEAVREKEEEESKGERASERERPFLSSSLPVSGADIGHAACCFSLSGGPSLERQEGGRELGGRERFLSCLHFNERWEVVLSQRVLLETP